MKFDDCNVGNDIIGDNTEVKMSNDSLVLSATLFRTLH